MHFRSCCNFLDTERGFHLCNCHNALHTSVVFRHTSSSVPEFNVIGSDHSIEAIPDLGRTLVGHPGFPKSFVFDMVTIPAIWMIVALCPNIDPKKIGLELLRAMQPRVECVRDSRILVQTGEMFWRRFNGDLLCCSSLLRLREVIHGRLSRSGGKEGCYL